QGDGLRRLHVRDTRDLARATRALRTADRRFARCGRRRCDERSTVDPQLIERQRTGLLDQICSILAQQPVSERGLAQLVEHALDLLATGTIGLRGPDAAIEISQLA